MDSVGQAYVFWEYAKYFVNGFAIQSQNNGTAGIISMANFVGPALADAFWNTYNYLLPTLQNNVIYSNTTSPPFNLKNCE